MQGMTSSKATTSSKVGNPPMAATKATNDDSGLDDLKDLATSAKQRRTKRRTTQMEAEQSLLASSAALDAVVLPDPNKSVAVPLPTISVDAKDKGDVAEKALVTSAAETTSHPTSVAVDQAPDEGGSKSKVGLIVVVLGVAAAAVAAFVILGNGDTSATDTNQVSANSEKGSTEANALTPDEPDPETKSPTEVVAPPTEPGANNAIVAADEGDTEEVEPETQEPAIAAVKKPTKELSPEEKAAADKKKAERLAARAAAKAEQAKTEPKDKKSTDKTATPKDKSGKGDSLDDVLSSVTGGLDTPTATKETAVPTKKTLGRGDVKKAMRKVAGAAKACHKLEEFSGMVSVKYSVKPNGTLTNITATGAHKSSKTGRCVVKAVTRAKFPAFSGSPMSFSFPFMLSP